MKLLTDITHDLTFAELEIGQTVLDGNATVVNCTKLRNRVVGDVYASWVAVCVREHNLHPFVVWTVIARPEGFIAESGDYCETLENALSFYEARGGK